MTNVPGSEAELAAIQQSVGLSDHTEVPGLRMARGQRSRWLNRNVRGAGSVCSSRDATARPMQSIPNPEA